MSAPHSMIRSSLVAALVGLAVLASAGCEDSENRNPQPGQSGVSPRGPSGPVGPLAQQRNVLDALAAAGDFDELVRWIRDLKLEINVRAPEAITVFAPTDEAFAALPEGAFEGWKEDPAIASAPILSHFVRARTLTIEQLKTVDTRKIQSIVGPLPTLEDVDGELTFGGAKIVRPDIECTNGVIHGIDRFILPPR